MNRARTLPLALAVPVAAGSDPDVIEIEDCGHVYGDFPPIDDPCPSPKSKTGQHLYSDKDSHVRCVYCGQPNGWD